MIRFDQVSIRYPESSRTVLKEVDLEIPDGEMCLVVGETGSGKSTLLGAVNGLVPRFTGGHIDGTVTVDGRSTAELPLREFADLVAYVPQNPKESFVTGTVEEELAYGMEQLGVEPATMRRRVEEMLDLFTLDTLRSRPLNTLSGGEQQRVAIGAAMAAGARTLVLDEPTSALDPLGAEEVLATLLRLVHDLAVTALVSEHRLERVVGYADSIIILDGSGNAEMGSPSKMMTGSPVVPPVVELGRALDWHPLPLTVREGRRHAVDITLTPPPPTNSPPVTGDPITVRGLTVSYGSVRALRAVDLDLPRGGVTAVMGRNGSGKSSLLWGIQGDRDSGVVAIGGEDPADLTPVERRQLTALVPQDPGHLLFSATVAEECRLSDGGDGECRRLLDSLSPGIEGDRDPFDLSEGQRLALALALQLGARPSLILLDEPTRGLDYKTKERLGIHLTELNATVVVATHDVEFVARFAQQVVLLAGGEVVAAGDTADIVTSSPVFAPQTSKIFNDSALTVADALERIPTTKTPR